MQSKHFHTLISEGRKKSHTALLREPIHIERYRYWLWLTDSEERCWVPFSDVIRLMEWPAEHFGITFSVHCKTAYPRYHSLMNLMTSLVTIMSENQLFWHDKRSSSPELFHLHRSFLAFRIAAGMIMAVTEKQTSSSSSTTPDAAASDHPDTNLTDFITAVHEAAGRIPKTQTDLCDDVLIHDIVVHRWFDMMCFSPRPGVPDNKQHLGCSRSCLEEASSEQPYEHRGHLSKCCISFGTAPERHFVSEARYGI